jgi:hypothetical protein
MIRFLFTGSILLLGLSIAQVLATLQVYTSNLEYYAFLTSVQQAGYLAVPNENVFSTLRNLGPAFCGGLFFTLTAGAALTIISFCLAWAWDRLFSRNRIVLWLLILCLLLCLAAANILASSHLITGYLLFVPLAVFPCTLKRLPKPPKNQSRTDVVYPLVMFLVLASILVLWNPSGTQEDRFLDIRDRCLLSNPLGRQVNAFYYENSLYATRVFASYRQQPIKGCRLDGISEPSLAERITQVLLSRDYLPLGGTIRPDLRISPSNGDLAFYSGDRLALRVPVREFFRNPALILTQFESRTAKNTFLRDFILFSLFFLGAVILFTCTYAPIYFLSGLFLKTTPRVIKAGILCPALLLVAFFLVSSSHTQDLSDPDALQHAMRSDHLHSRIAALKYILRSDMDIAAFPAYQEMLNSPHIPERYWLAKALGKSRTRGTHKALHRLLEDSQFNVVCMALDTLGNRGNRADIPALLKKIEISDNWYEQWYAYRAIRRLGWRQTEPQQEERRPASLPPRQ